MHEPCGREAWPQAHTLLRRALHGTLGRACVPARWGNRQTACDVRPFSTYYVAPPVAPGSCLLSLYCSFCVTRTVFPGMHVWRSFPPGCMLELRVCWCVRTGAQRRAAGPGGVRRRPPAHARKGGNSGRRYTPISGHASKAFLCWGQKGSFQPGSNGRPQDFDDDTITVLCSSS